MGSLEQPNGGTDSGWKRVSSFKPYVAGLLLTGIVAVCMLLVFRKGDARLLLVASGVIIATGLIALNWKVVHQRGNHYRITTLFYTEEVTVDDVCMMVRNPRPLWTQMRIHLRRPARFGWMISFTPADRSPYDLEAGAPPAQCRERYAAK